VPAGDVRDFRGVMAPAGEGTRGRGREAPSSPAAKPRQGGLITGNGTQAPATQIWGGVLVRQLLLQLPQWRGSARGLMQSPSQAREPIRQAP
jgi:hypothetical protein